MVLHLCTDAFFPCGFLSVLAASLASSRDLVLLLTHSYVLLFLLSLYFCYCAQVQIYEFFPAYLWARSRMAYMQKILGEIGRDTSEIPCFLALNYYQ